MKKLIGFVILVFLVTIAWNLFSNPDASTEALLKSIAESEELKNWIAEHPADQLVGDAADTLTNTFPFLKDLFNLDNWKKSLETTGLDLLRSYMDNNATDKANTLGEVIKILSPDLKDEVNAILHP